MKTTYELADATARVDAVEVNIRAGGNIGGVMEASGRELGSQARRGRWGYWGRRMEVEKLLISTRWIAYEEVVSGRAKGGCVCSEGVQVSKGGCMLMG